MGAPNVSFAKGGEVLEGVKLLLMLLDRCVRVVRRWGILVLDYEGVEGSLRGVKDCSVLLAGVTYCYVLLAGLKVITYY
jgi:hypothetical protein